MLPRPIYNIIICNNKEHKLSFDYLLTVIYKCTFNVKLHILKTRGQLDTRRIKQNTIR